MLQARDPVDPSTMHNMYLRRASLDAFTPDFSFETCPSGATIPLIEDLNAYLNDSEGGSSSKVRERPSFGAIGRFHSPPPGYPESPFDLAFD